MNFFDKIKKLSGSELQELAALCGGAALLIVVAGFVANGGIEMAARSVALSGTTPGSQTASIFPCSWFGDCPTSAGSWIQSIYPASQTITQGQPATINWVSYSCGPVGCAGNCVNSGPNRFWPNSGFVCSLKPNAPDTTYTSGIVLNNPSFATGVGTGPTPSVVYPSSATTYYFCSDVMVARGYPCLTSTIYVTPPIPPVSADATTNSPRTVGQSATISFHADSATLPTRCHIANYDGSVLLYEFPGPTCPSSANASYTTPAYTAPGTYSYQFWYLSAAGSWVRAKTVSVTVTEPVLGPCNDIPPATTVPNGCVSPSPAPGTCIPSGGSYSSAANACSCPAGQHVEGTTCVADPLCSNGLNDSYAPTCTCPSGQYQPLGVSSCITLPICTNGLSQAYSPSCACPAGEVQVAGGSTCTLAGVINDLTVNPTRVRKGNSATVSWNTTAMTSCALRGPASGATATLSTALSGSVNVVVTSQLIYRLECLDASGALRSSSATVNLIPEVIEQ